MRTLKIGGRRGECNIVLGESASNLGKYCNMENAIAVTDANVRAALGPKFPECETIEIGMGEGNKTLATVEKVYEKLLESGAERSTTLVGIGGGIVCDVAGFAASTYLRGLRFCFVPTTLLAQVDASIGGKNGVNFMGYKNLIGTINQPSFVLCDFTLLRTLPRAEIASGFAEVIKHAVIGDSALFEYLEGDVEKALSLDSLTMEKIIHDSLRVKAKIVSVDETEKGERRKLNFGHTVGHAIENILGLRHGEAVAIGMLAAARLSQAKGMISGREVERLEGLLVAYGLPTSIKGGDSARIIDAMEKDKKKESGKIKFVLLERIGKARLAEIPLGELKGVVDDLH